MKPVLILDLSGERYHFGNLAEMIVWLDGALDPEDYWAFGRFFWTTSDRLPEMGCVDYQEGE